MERNTKILLGLGAVALGYYLYTKNKAKSVAQPSSANPCKNPNEVPCNNGSGKCYMANAQYITDPCKIDKPQSSTLMGDVDENYNKCVKEFASLPKPSFRHDPKQYYDEFIKECLKRKQPNYRPSTDSITSLRTIYTCKDGSKEEVNEMQKVKREPPCKNKGGIINSTFK
jgi:hypothetical protein